MSTRRASDQLLNTSPLLKFFKGGLNKSHDAIFAELVPLGPTLWRCEKKPDHQPGKRGASLKLDGLASRVDEEAGSSLPIEDEVSISLSAQNVGLAVGDIATCKSVKPKAGREVALGNRLECGHSGVWLVSKRGECVGVER